MAIDVCCSEIICSSIVVSPARISFSHDLNQIDEQQQQYNINNNNNNSHRSDRSDILDFVSDFNFCIGECFELEPASTADELFSNGKILPMEIKKKVVVIKDNHHDQSEASQSLPPPTSTTTTTTDENEKKKSLKELLATSNEEEYQHPSSSKPFWQFRRSSSLNVDNARSKSLIRSLKFLSRSNSTGSAPKLEKSILSKNSQKQHLQKQASATTTTTTTTAFEKERPSVPCSSGYYPYSSSPKPPLKKKKNEYQRSSSYGNGIRISPVLNLPPHYISKGSVGLFGLGSIFCNSKDKKKKK